MRGTPAAGSVRVSPGSAGTPQVHIAQPHPGLLPAPSQSPPAARSRWHPGGTALWYHRGGTRGRGRVGEQKRARGAGMPCADTQRQQGPTPSQPHPRTPLRTATNAPDPLRCRSLAAASDSSYVRLSLPVANRNTRTLLRACRDAVAWQSGCVNDGHHSAGLGWLGGGGAFCSAAETSTQPGNTRTRRQKRWQTWTRLWRCRASAPRSWPWLARTGLRGRVGRVEAAVTRGPGLLKPNHSPPPPPSPALIAPHQTLCCPFHPLHPAAHPCRA